MGQSPTWGRPAPQLRLEIQFRGCRACKNLRGQHTQGPKYSLPKKIHLSASAYNFFVS